MYINIVPHIIVPHICVFQIVQFDRTAAWKEQMPRQYDPFWGTLKSPDTSHIIPTLLTDFVEYPFSGTLKSPGASQHNSRNTDAFVGYPFVGYT